MSPAEPTTEAQRPRAQWGEKDLRSADIREAARVILRRDGLAGMTMRAVAKQAGVALGTVYSYFASKDALYADLYAERLEQLGTDLSQACAAATTTEQVFTLLSDLYFDLYQTFGRELDLWSMLAGIKDEAQTPAAPEATTVRLVTAAITAFSAALDQVERVEPRLADILRAEDQLGLQMLWITVTGLAEHFSSSRHLLYPNSRAELTEVGVRVLVAGLRAELAEA